MAERLLTFFKGRLYAKKPRLISALIRRAERERLSAMRSDRCAVIRWSNTEAGRVGYYKI